VTGHRARLRGPRRKAEAISYRRRAQDSVAHDLLVVNLDADLYSSMATAFRFLGRGFGRARFCTSMKCRGLSTSQRRSSNSRVAAVGGSSRCVQTSPWIGFVLNASHEPICRKMCSALSRARTATLCNARRGCDQDRVSEASPSTSSTRIRPGVIMKATRRPPNSAAGAGRVMGKAPTSRQ
jgi:hypothetical protein